MKRLKATRDFLRPPQSREELAQMLAETLSVADKYVQLMDADTRLAQKHHIHGRLWAWAVYPRIEQLRHHAKQGRITQEWAAEWRVWMNAVERIFVDLLKKQGVLVSGSSGNLHVASIKINPQAHKNFNPLADLGRYRAQLFSDYDFETGPVLESSLELYHYSAHCFPENGLYYNKASLLYKQMQRPLEAVCYSLRAMCVKQPLESAREGFVVIMARFTEAASAEEMPEGIVIEVLRVVDMLLERIALDLFPQSMQLLKYTLERELSRDPDNRHDSLTPLWITMTAIATIHINTQAEMGDDMRNLLQEYACELLSDCVCAPDPKCLATLQPETLHGLAIANQLPADSFVPEDTWLRGFVPLNETHGGRAVAERAVRSQPFLVTWAKMDHEQVLPVHCTRMDVLIAAVSATHKINPTPAPAASLDAGKIARRKSDPSTGQSSESIKTVRFEDLEIEDERGDGIGSARQKQAAAGKPLNAPPVGMFESLRALVDLASKDKEIQELKVSGIWIA
nr:hypothetical protein HK105_002117 [Polyrhizophydium stewartii]